MRNPTVIWAFEAPEDSLVINLIAAKNSHIADRFEVISDSQESEMADLAYLSYFAMEILDS